MGVTWGIFFHDLFYVANALFTFGEGSCWLVRVGPVLEDEF